LTNSTPYDIIKIQNKAKEKMKMNGFTVEELKAVIKLMEEKNIEDVDFTIGFENKYVWIGENEYVNLKQLV
jgi:hypothetical protein